MAGLIKPTLLLIYLTALFLLARILEVVSRYDHGQMSLRHLDPKTLSVYKLKAVLDQRGVNYDEVVEKSDLEYLVKASGAIHEEELAEMQSAGQTDYHITNFTGNTEFHEQVEDSIWLVEVVSDRQMLLSDTSWSAIRRKLGAFGVRFGQFNCQLNVRLCTRRQWFTSRLVLALPESYRGKINVAFHSYNGHVTINSLVSWVKRKVNKQIQPIGDLQTFQSTWLKFDSPFTSEIRVIFISSMSSVPLSLSALSVKFPDRVKIGSINTSTRKGKQLVKKAEIEAAPAYIVLTREGIYIYGSGKGEAFTFRAMEMFLKSLYPNLNDIFMISIVCTNIAGLFEISLVKGTFMRRFGKYLIWVLKYNAILLLAWIVVLTYQLPFLDVVCLVGLKLLRTCAANTFASFIRKYVMYYMSNLTLPLVVAGVMNVIVAYAKSRYSPENLDGERRNYLNPTINSDEREGPDVSLNEEEHNDLGRERLEVNSDVDEENDLNPADASAEGERLYRRNSPNLHNTGYEQGLFPITMRLQLRQSSDQTVNLTISDTGDVLEVNHALSEEFIKQLPCWYFREPGASGEADGTCFTSDASTHSLNIHRHKPDGYSEDSMCVICQENYQNLALLKGLPCGHVFHARCIAKWLVERSRNCPSCRWSADNPRMMS